PDGRSLATRGLEGVRVWETATGRFISRFDLRKDNLLPAVSYSADGSELFFVTNSPGAALRSLDPTSGKEKRSLELGDQPSATMVVVSPDGRCFAVSR